MKFKNFYIIEKEIDWMNMIIEAIKTPQRYSTRTFATNIKQLPTPEEMLGYNLQTFDHGAGNKDGTGPSTLFTFAIDDDGLIHYVAIGTSENPISLGVQKMTGSNMIKDKNLLYTRSIEKDDEGHISTKEIDAPFIS